MTKKKKPIDLSMSLFSDEDMGVQPGYIKPGNRQPSYPIQRVGTYIRKSDGILCYYPVVIKPFEVYVQQARAIWGDRYDYSNSKYTSNKEPINIYCPKHDFEFRVAMAQNHVMKAHGTFKPTGCPVCSYEKQHGVEYGTDWRKYLKVCAKNNRVGKIENMTHLSEEEKARRKAEREKKRLQNDKKTRQREANRALIEKYNAKNLKEALFLEKFHAKYGDCYGTELLDYQDRHQKITLVCPEHGPFQTTSRLLFQNSGGRQPHGCWKCEGITPPWEKPKPKVYDSDEFFAKMHELYGNRFDFSNSVYVNKHTPITFICNKHGEQTNTPQTLLKGKGCDYCSGRKFYWPDFERLAREKHGDKYDYRYVRPKKNLSGEVTIICPVHGRFKQRAGLHLMGYGCRECVGYPNKKTPEQRCQEFINKCLKKYGPNHYDYSRVHEDYVNNDSPVWIKCLIHDEWFQTTPDNNLRTVAGSCPICAIEMSESEGEAEIRRWLSDQHIRFEQEFNIPNENPLCNRQYLRVDFWVPDRNLFIEYNGEQHYREIDHFHDKDWSFEDQQIRDQTLRDYCKNHGINLLEIPYTKLKSIPNILKKNLKVKA